MDAAVMLNLSCERASEKWCPLAFRRDGVVVFDAGDDAIQSIYDGGGGGGDAAVDVTK